MKTHHDKIGTVFVTPGTVQIYRDEMPEHSLTVEFVPAAAYVELKTRLEKAEFSANGFESLYDAAHAENESLKTQLQTQTENMRALEEIRKKLEFAIVCAEDYICHFELENDISRQEFLYIRDAVKCLRETDCV